MARNIRPARIGETLQALGMFVLVLENASPIDYEDEDGDEDERWKAKPCV